jgi:hypothetical protein
MKVRTDFVTNSSSSSFCLIGVGASTASCVSDDDELDMHELFEDLFEGDETILTYDYVGDIDYGAVGVSPDWFKRNPDKTWDDLVEVILEAFDKIKPGVVKKEDIGVHVDGGYDG